MKAILRTKFGQPISVLKIAERQMPKPLPTQILVKVKSVGVSRADAGFTTGNPWIMRIIAALMNRSGILGAEVAGEVVALGSEVTDFKLGNEIFADIADKGFGGFAEYVAIEQNIAAIKPSNVSFIEASASAQAAVVALQALRNHGQVKSGQTVLVIGAAGGVGSFAVQIAKAYGAVVTGVCNTSQLEIVRQLGAGRVIDYTKQDILKLSETYDLIIDTVAAHSFRKFKPLLSATGRYILVGGSMRRLLEIGLFGNKRMFNFLAKLSKQDLSTIKELIEASKVKPLISKVFKFAETGNAVALYIEGNPYGKVVVEIE